MRLWSIHPKYLDRAGLVALWREGLLAQKVLQGKTVGYRNHPQLVRFKRVADPVGAIGAYLLSVWEEACRRGYCFDKSKIVKPNYKGKLQVTTGNVEYEFSHLKKKVENRDKAHHDSVHWHKGVEAHPIFTVVSGDVEEWEKKKD
ncbi:pyrimidine dimer DNA glycosylase/endonuclease V [Candidatus Woesearchaeota archaeon]|nr:pyrimidine dimer DNA glycosylase/endonuclease V [Candidatus Woesearchaeota archaeon]